MLRSIDAVEKGFRKVTKKSIKDCGNELEEMRKLSFVSANFFKAFYIFQKEHKKEYGPWGNCLYHACLLELFRTSGSILFLSSNGLYRNAYDEIRHTLESIVQAVYLDSRHLNTPIEVKIEILKEIEDKREYHAVRLIGELKIAHKDKLHAEYKELSRMIHPSHRQILTLLRDIKKHDEGIPITVDCAEILNIFESMKKMYDIFIFLILNHFSALREPVKKDVDFTKCIKLYKLPLVAEIIGVKI